MSAQTREELKQAFSDNNVATGAMFANLIDSFKMIQSAVSDPAAMGTSVTFIATISQDTEGRITVTKKTVNFQGYQTTSAMAGYQNLDLQQVGNITVNPGQSQHVNHNKNHYPTVRLIDSTGLEVKPTEFNVRHQNTNVLIIEIGAAMTDSYRYILD